MSRPHPVSVGEKYGSLTIIETGHRIGEATASKCRCDCGTEKIVRNTNMRQGITYSCGCMRQKIIEQRHTKAERDPRCRFISLTDTRHNAHDGIGSGVTLPRGMSSMSMI